MRKVVIYIEEVWKDINEFKGYYQVSNFGRIKSLFRYVKVKNGFRSVPEKILKPKMDICMLFYKKMGNQGILLYIELLRILLLIILIIFHTLIIKTKINKTIVWKI